MKQHWTIWFLKNRLKALNLTIKLLHQKEKVSGHFCQMSLKRLQYCLKKCVGPSVLTFPDNEASKFILDYADKRHPLWSLMWVRLIPRSVPSWTGFQILVCDNFPVLRTTVGYLNCIDAFSTEMLYWLLFLSFSSAYARAAKYCRIFEAFFSCLCFHSSN